MYSLSKRSPPTPRSRLRVARVTIVCVCVLIIIYLFSPVVVVAPRPTDRRNANSGLESKSLVARVLASVSELTDDVGSFVRSAEELFLLVRDLAMGHEAVRRHLLACDMAAKLSVFVTRELAPAEVGARSRRKERATGFCRWYFASGFVVN